MLRIVLIAAAIVTAAVAGALVGRVTGPSTPDDYSVDAGFARDMSLHHSQAVDMAMTVRNHTTATDVRVLAYDIALTQQEQIGRMRGWLVSWKLSPTSSRPAMAWMGGSHEGHGGPNATLLPDGRMPGMASSQDLARLRSLTGRSAEVLFLQLMVAHHRGGIPMAEYAAEHAERADARAPAGAIAGGQSAEVKVIQDMLRARGAPPA